VQSTRKLKTFCWQWSLAEKV